MLALVWATKKLHVYLYGLQEYQVLVDHAPLVPILNRYALGAVENPRLMRLKEKLQAYNFLASHIKGKENFIADALSRAPHRDPIPDEEEEGEDVMCIPAVITRSMERPRDAEERSGTNKEQ